MLEPIAAPFFAVLGAVLASFLGVIAERVQTGGSWVSGRSACNSCAAPLRARDLVPVLSWLSARGRCRSCGSRVPVAYVLGEATLGSLFALAYLRLGLVPELTVFLLALCTLFFTVLYDLRHTLVPRVASGLLVAFSIGYAMLVSDGEALGETLVVAAAIALGFFLLHALSRGRAMGLGDAPVALALATLVGAPHAVAGLLFSFWIGAAVGIVVLVGKPKGHRMGIEVPFVPFLAAGYALAFFTQWNPLAFVP